MKVTCSTQTRIPAEVRLKGPSGSADRVSAPHNSTTASGWKASTTADRVWVNTCTKASSPHPVNGQTIGWVGPEGCGVVVERGGGGGEAACTVRNCALSARCFREMAPSLKV